MPRDEEMVCPCGAAATYEDCCGRFHRGEAEAPTPEALMRSRFSAFVRGEVRYLYRTLHADHDERRLPEAAVIEHLRQGLSRLKYRELHILDTRDADGEGVAQVLFHVVVYEKGKNRSFVELSSFAHDGEGWRYLFGAPQLEKDIKGNVRELRLGDYRAPSA